jgi:hypothetical protein
MKWREVRDRNVWSTAPMRTHFSARKGGKHYTVQAAWANWANRAEPIVWWSHDGQGTNKCWATKDDAIAWCEQDAGVVRESPC